MHHHRPPQAEAGQGIGHRIEQLNAGNPHHLGFRPQRIHQRTQQIEYGAHPQAAAQGRQGHQGRMPGRGEQEGETHPGQGRHHLGSIDLQRQAEGLEHIGGAHPATGAAIAMLGHSSAAGGGHKGHGGGDVEAVGPIAAGAAGIHQGHGRPLHGQRTGLAQYGCHGSQLLTIDALGAQGRQQGTGKHRIDRLGQPTAHQLRGLVGRERTALEQLLQQGWPGGRDGGHRGART